VRIIAETGGALRSAMHQMLSRLEAALPAAITGL